MFLVSAHCDTHPDVLGRTLMINSDGMQTCQCLEEFDHPVHHIESMEPKARQRRCERQLPDGTLLIREGYEKYRSNDDIREGNHRQHSRRDERRAPKQALLLAQMAS
ncbi:MAG TPA: hypothetical protein VJ579_03225 [Candidatus Paceibacterota bacterium]|nr:hypothetical protein [Candidatus Paceibacterota bacterium]